MSSPVYDPEDHDGHLRYAPKSVRDSNFQKSPSIAEGEFPEDSEPSDPIERLIADLEGSPHPLEIIANAARQHSSTSPPRAEDKSSGNGEQLSSARTIGRAYVAHSIPSSSRNLDKPHRVSGGALRLSALPLGWPHWER